MQRMRAAHVALLCLVLLSAAAPLALCEQEQEKPAKIDPEAAAVVRQMADYYAGLKGLKFTVSASMTVQAQGVTQRGITTAQIALERPNKLKATVQAQSEQALVASNGTDLYMYLPARKEYVVAKAPTDTAEFIQQSCSVGALASPMSMLAALLGEKPYERLMEGVTEGRYVGDEEIDGVAYDHVKFFQDQFDWETWTQKGDKPLLHRLVQDPTKALAAAAAGSPGAGDLKVLIEATFAKWEVNPELPPEAFEFSAPEGAQKVDSFWKEEPHPLLGKPAPTFKLDLLGGGEVDLESHLGKHVVILDFWATWCGPCERALPILVEVSEAYKDKGVVFYAVNIEEEPARIRRFMAKNELTCNVALDGEGRVSELYGVGPIPQSVIIGKDGTVQAVHVGLLPALKSTLEGELETLLAGESLLPKPEPEPQPEPEPEPQPEAAAEEE